MPEQDISCIRMQSRFRVIAKQFLNHYKAESESFKPHTKKAGRRFMILCESNDYNELCNAEKTIINSQFPILSSF